MQWLLKYQSEQAVQKQESRTRPSRSRSGESSSRWGGTGSISIAESLDLEELSRRLSDNVPPESPFVTTPKREAEASRSFVSLQEAQNWPRLTGVASAGVMESARLVSKEDYAGWIGFALPVFEGFRISAETEQARAQADRAEELAGEARLQLADIDAKFVEDERTHEIDVRRFAKEREYSIRALKLAEYRYTTFVGDLADVRDSLYSYEAAESGLVAAQVELSRARLARAIMNGSRLPR